MGCVDGGGVTLAMEESEPVFEGLLRSLGIDSLPSGIESCACNCKRFWSPGIDSASLCSLARKLGSRTGPTGWESIPVLLKRSTNTSSGLFSYIWWRRNHFFFSTSISFMSTWRRSINTRNEDEWVKMFQLDREVSKVRQISTVTLVLKTDHYNTWFDFRCWRSILEIDVRSAFFAALCCSVL